MSTPQQLRLRRKNRQRAKIRKVLDRRLRLSVHRTGQHIYAQIIDDNAGRTLVASSSLEPEMGIKNGGNKAAAQAVGANLAKKALSLQITQVVFDRSGFLYHGRVKALADSARENGLVF